MFDNGMPTVGVKELHTNFKSIAEKASRGQEFIVIKHSKPLFRIVPMGKVNKTNRNKKFKSLFTEFEDLRFHTGDPTLSQNIDKILYS